MKGNGSIRSGAGTGGASTNPAGKASNALMNALQSGKFQRMGYEEQDRMLAAADKESSKLTENRDIYSDSEWDAMTAYLGSGYERMNEYSIGVSKGDSETRQLVSDLDKAIRRRKLTKDIVVWRGSDNDESTSGRFKSTSLKASVADKFRTGKHLHAYVIPKGTHFLYTERKGESEVILPRDFDLRKHMIK